MTTYNLEKVAKGITNVHLRAGDVCGRAAFRNAVRYYSLNDNQTMELDIAVGSLCIAETKPKYSWQHHQECRDKNKAQAQEINELKARVQRLCEVAQMIGLQDAYIDYEFCNEVLSETPAQSLTRLKK